MKGERNDGRLTRQKTKAMRKEQSEKHSLQAIGRLDQYADLPANTHPYRHVPYEDLKKTVLAAVKPKEDVWKNPRRGDHNKAAWEEIGRAVYAKTLKYEEIKPLQQILENTKRMLRRKISELVLEDLTPGEMEKQLKLWKGYEDCKFLRESVYGKMSNRFLSYHHNCSFF
ncbi:hypothetical protein CAEBREN_00903 [Caenorhabditis brenneri]|uniref:MADF domain-containing protein n=1 Tax=Caenorhabditis brenneri TaxID=135651 RepID=G0NV52_CAEBE|nr:hypothetical protein CAEBREN_00903 [Caenorhabditis brenneri]